MLLFVFLISLACLPSLRSDNSKILIITTSDSNNDNAIEINEERNVFESPEFYSDVDLPTVSLSHIRCVACFLRFPRSFINPNEC